MIPDIVSKSKTVKMFFTILSNKIEVSQKRPSYVKLSGFLCTSSPLNGQNLLSWPKTFCRRPLSSCFTIRRWARPTSKRCRSVKIKIGVYKTEPLTYFDRKHCSINSIWYPCCLSLQGQYLRRNYCLLNWITTSKIRRKLNFGINDYLEMVIIICQKHLS